MKKETVAFIVPTGIGASIGGFAGDASKWARKFSKDFNVIVNPNVVNAACFSGITENMLYTEGWSLTEFFKGNINLKPSNNNKIGVIFDKAIPQDVLNIHINTINAVKTVYDVDIIGWQVTEEPCGVDFFITESGISSGQLNNPETLLIAGKKLLEQGAEALAVVALFDEPDDGDDYANGIGVDIVGGIEAVISHYLSSELNIPVAHAPAFEDYEIQSDIVDPRAASEYITPTFLPCILLGLSQAPKLCALNDGINVKNISALIMPHNALGSCIVFEAIKNKIPVYAIKENSSILNIDKNKINIQNEIIEMKGYNECLNHLKN